jgi:hypothetical protein
MVRVNRVFNLVVLMVANAVDVDVILCCHRRSEQVRWRRFGSASILTSAGGCPGMPLFDRFEIRNSAASSKSVRCWAVRPQQVVTLERYCHPPRTRCLRTKGHTFLNLSFRPVLSRDFQHRISTPYLQYLILRPHPPHKKIRHRNTA